MIIGNRAKWGDVEVAIALGLAVKLHGTNTAVRATCKKLHPKVRRGLRGFLIIIENSSKSLELARDTIRVFNEDEPKENHHELP